MFMLYLLQESENISCALLVWIRVPSPLHLYLNVAVVGATSVRKAEIT